MTEVEIRDYERGEVVGTVSNSGIETDDDLLSEVADNVLTEDGTIETIYPGEEPGEYKAVEVAPDDEGFVRVVVDALPSPFDISDLEDLEELPEYMPEMDDGQKTIDSPGVVGLMKAEWIPYQGPQGGEGWQNVESGEVDYGDEPPGDADVSPEDYYEANTDDLIDAIETVTGNKVPDSWREASADELRIEIQDVASPEDLAQVIEELGSSEDEGVNQEDFESSVEGFGFNVETDIVDPEALDFGEPVRLTVEQDGEESVFEGVIDTQALDNLGKIWISSGSQSIAIEEDEITDAEKVSIDLEGVPDDISNRVYQYPESARSDLARGLREIADKGMIDNFSEFKTTSHEGGGDTEYGSFDPEDASIFVNPSRERIKNLKRDYRDGYNASESYASVVFHEAVHATQAKNADKDEIAKQMRAGLDRGDARILKSEVSHYASRNPLEAVAEIAVKMFQGEEVSDELIEIYQKYGGPEL